MPAIGKRTFVVGVVAVVLIAATLACFHARAPAAVSSLSAPAVDRSNGALAWMPRALPGSNRRNVEAASPRSYDGTQVDGGVSVDASGHLQPTRELRVLFDYFSMAFGEIELVEIERRLQGYLQARKLSSTVVAEAMALFHRYNEYRAAFAQMPAPSFDDNGALRRALQTRNELRRSYLGVVAADAFFHDEEAFDQYTLERLAITRNRQLSPEEKERRLALLRQTLPPDVAAREEAMYRVGRVAQDVEALKVGGASPEAIQQLRTERLGPEAAARLEQLDRARDEWQERFNAYREARAQILARPGLTPEQQEAAIDALVRSRFSDAEALRVSALDRIEQMKRR